jgi:hypothetical protein
MDAHTEPAYDVFISYSHRDSEVVVAIDTALRLNGLQVFLDRRDISLGDRLVEAVFEGIAGARTQLVVLSPSSVASNWVREELYAGRSRAIDEQLRVIPVLVEHCSVPPALAHLKYLDLTEWLTDRSFRRGMSELLATLGVSQYNPEDAELAWVIQHATVLHQLELEFTTARGEVLGGVAEGLELDRDRGGTANKWVLNDTPLASSLLRDESVPWPLDLLRAAEAAHGPGDGCFAGGLAVLQTWLDHAAQPPPGNAVALLREAIDMCAAQLDTLGIRPWERVMSRETRKATTALQEGLRRICEALNHLTGILLRTAIPFPTTRF